MSRTIKKYRPNIIQGLISTLIGTIAAIVFSVLLLISSTVTEFFSGLYELPAKVDELTKNVNALTKGVDNSETTGVSSHTPDISPKKQIKGYVSRVICSDTYPNNKIKSIQCQNAPDKKCCEVKGKEIYEEHDPVGNFIFINNSHTAFKDEILKGKSVTIIKSDGKEIQAKVKSGIPNEDNNVIFKANTKVADELGLTIKAGIMKKVTLEYPSSK